MLRRGVDRGSATAAALARGARHLPSARWDPYNLLAFTIRCQASASRARASRKGDDVLVEDSILSHELHPILTMITTYYHMINVIQVDWVLEDWMPKP